MVGKDARGKGVFTNLGKYALENLSKNKIDITSGYPIRKGVIPGHLKVGWDQVLRLPMYGKFLKFDSFLKVKSLPKLIPLANFIVKTYHYLNFNFIKPKKNDINIETYNKEDIKKIEGLNQFFITLKNEYKNYLNKTKDFIDWRLGAPKKEYSIVILRKNKNIIGYTILHAVEKKGVPCLGILDFAVVKKEKKYKDILFKEIDKIAKNNNLELILVMISKFQAKEYGIFKNGFFKTPYYFTLILNVLNKSIDKKDLIDIKNWHLMWIDSDNL